MAMNIMFLLLFVIMMPVIGLGIFILIELKELKEEVLSVSQMMKAKVEKKDQD